jgi:hypothetical protein
LPFSELDHLTNEEFVYALNGNEGRIKFSPEEKERQPLLTKFSLLACVLIPDRRPKAKELADEVRASQSG